MPSRKARVAVLALLVVAAVAAVAFGLRYLYPPDRFDPRRLAEYYSALQPMAAPAVDDAAVARAAQAAAAYIRAHNDPATGEFTYTVSLDPSIPVVRDYSILRHQGTVYSLAMVDDVFPDPQNVVVMQRAIQYMRKCCYVQLDAGATGIADPDYVPNPDDRKYLHLGGAGLGLLALAATERKVPGFVSLDEMQQVARFGRSMQRRDGSFYGLYDKATGERTAHNKSLYYPGEMAKGWVALYEQHPERREDLQSAVLALEYLADRRAREGSAPADHWALLATARLLHAAPAPGVDVPREKLLRHALQICDAMLEEARHPQPLPVMDGSLAPNGEVTPTATRLEGLLAALTFLPPEHPIVPHVRAAVARGIDYLLRAQVQDGPYAGGFPGVIAVLPENGAKDVIALNREAKEIRIDYVQHSLSALVQYLQRAR